MATKRSKGTKTVKSSKTAPAAPAPIVTAVASVATKLTKRNATPTSAMLVATEKLPKSRAEHNKTAWAAVLKALPATATQLAELPALANPLCVSPQAYISYMLRRGHLMPKA